jgi:hypothetical protein
MKDEPPVTGTTTGSPQTARAQDWADFRTGIEYDHFVTYRCPACGRQSMRFDLDSEAETAAREHWAADHAGR